MIVSVPRGKSMNSDVIWRDAHFVAGNYCLVIVLIGILNWLSRTGHCQKMFMKMDCLRNWRNNGLAFLYLLAESRISFIPICAPSVANYGPKCSGCQIGNGRSMYRKICKTK